METEKPELLFEDLTVGREFRPLRFELSQELVKTYMEAVGDRNPLYWDSSRSEGNGGLFAPPGLSAIFGRLSYLQDYSMPSGGLLAQQEFEYTAPMRIGDTLTVRAQVMDCYWDEKKRRRVNFKIEAQNQNGQSVCLIRLYAIWPK